jgi:hypothetical protein
MSRRSLAALTSLALAAVAAPSDQEAKKKKKKCKGGLTRCTVKKGKKKKTTCVNVQTDAANCGGCGRACTGGKTCSSGLCTSSGCLPVSASSELQAAIDAVEPGGTLELCAGTWSITTTVRIGADMTLRGAGIGQTILDGNDAVRVLWIDDPSATVDLQDLTIRRGFATGTENFGAGIRNDGSLSLRQVEVTKCRADRGGGIFSNGTLNLFAGASLSENHANNNGGGMYAWNTSAVTMHDGSQISKNTASSGGGVGLFGCPFTMESGSRISGNEGTSEIGGIYSLSATIVLQDGSLIGGSEPGDGNIGNANSGGIYASGGSVSLESGSRVIGNTATLGAGIGCSYSTVTVRNGARIIGNIASANGGAIQVFTGDATVEAGARVCDNLPLNAQCAGVINGQCPEPSQVCPV